MMAIHVIEHFWQWKVVSVLIEWVRVLKPAGKMILECPNLTSACKEFLRNPDFASQPGPKGKEQCGFFMAALSEQIP